MKKLTIPALIVVILLAGGGCNRSDLLADFDGSTTSGQGSVTFSSAAADSSRSSGYSSSYSGSSSSGFSGSSSSSSSTSAVAFPCLVARTGQTSSYQTYDDGAYQRGAPWPVPRFVDNGDGTITDNLTGLMWEKKPGGGNTGTDTPGAVLWQDAIVYCENLTLASHGDWRLANSRELRSLLNLEQGGQSSWLSSQGFLISANNYYWSSTIAPYDTTKSLIVNLANANILYILTNDTAYYWAVRGGSGGAIKLPQTGQTVSYNGGIGDDGAYQAGEPWPSPRFMYHGDGTVTDNLTGLMWEQKPGGGNDGMGSQMLMDWVSAISYCENLTLAGYGDWRLPNLNEISSLSHYGQSFLDSWLNSLGFISVQGTYWSATTFAASIANAFVLQSIHNVIASDKVADTHYVWAVRGGP